MADTTLYADRGEQLEAVFNYPTDLTGKVATFVARTSTTAADPAALELVSGQTSTAGSLTVDANAKTVTLTIHGPTTLTLPAVCVWSMWLQAGQDDATVISGALRLREVVQP